MKLVLGREIGDELSEGFHFGFFDETEFGDEVVEVLEASIEMSFLAEGYNAVEMAVVDVGVDAEQTFKNCLNHRLERLGERHICVRREYIFII